MRDAVTFILGDVRRLAKLSHEELNGKKVVVAPDMRVSKVSVFSDDVWQLKDPDNVRYITVNDSKTRIDWTQYVLPSSIVYDLKVLVVLCRYSSICSGGKRKRPQKPNTVVATVKAICKFISRIYENSVLLTRGRKTVSTVEVLSDVTYEMLQHAASEYPENGDEVAKGLRQLAKVEVRRFLSSDADAYGWGWIDVKNIKFAKFSNSSASQRNDNWEDKTLPNALFSFVTRHAVTDVATAITALGGEMQDLSAKKHVDSKVLEKFKEAQSILEDYIEIRRLDVARCEVSPVGVRANGSTVTNYTQSERKSFKSKYGINVKEFYDWWTVCRSSAQILILQYIGFRHSESLSLKFDHALPEGKRLIEKSGNVWMIHGTVSKHEDDKLPTDYDQWVAIPIVRDAIWLLEKLNKILEKSYVFSSSQARGGSVNSGKTYNRAGADKPYSPGGFGQAINRWKEKKDTVGEWGWWSFNVKQFRHSVANQLARADLGLEFITYQMKHMVNALSDMPSDVTLGYGGVGDMIQENALNAAKHEAVRNLYHPNCPVSGGMAEEFMAARDAHYKGAMASGFTEDEYFSMLVGQGIPFISVGGGYCTGRKYVQYSDGSKSQPACIGSYECSPKKCGNSVITKSHIPVWLDMYRTNMKNAADPELFYAMDDFVARANDAREVLEDLGIDLGAL